MPQKQKKVPLMFRDKTTGEAIATGNNAAWICACHYFHPLIGRTSTKSKVKATTRVDCTNCNRSYYIEPIQHDQDSLLFVLEIERLLKYGPDYFVKAIQQHRT